MKILVTGGNGYVGQHVVAALVSNGYSVRIFGRQRHDLFGQQVEEVVGDIRHLPDVYRAAEGCSHLIHLACLPVRRSIEQPVDDLQVNGLGTLHVLLAAREEKMQRVVYTSSAEVYGRPQHLPIDEEHPVHPITPYGVSKCTGELYCRLFARSFGVPTVTLRLFNVYGLAYDHSERPTVEMIFLKRALGGKAPVISGHPRSAKDFVHISDVTQAILLALTSADAAGQTVNVGSGVATSLLELAQQAIALAQADISPTINPTEEMPIIYQASLARAETLLGYVPTTELRDGLDEIRRWLSTQQLGA